MKINFQMPELLVTVSCVFFLNSIPVIGWVTLVLGLIASVCKAGMAANAEQKKSDDGKQMLQEMANTVITAVGNNYKAGSRNIN
jgi:hypothetical protein